MQPILILNTNSLSYLKDEFWFVPVLGNLVRKWKPSLGSTLKSSVVQYLFPSTTSLLSLILDISRLFCRFMSPTQLNLIWKYFKSKINFFFLIISTQISLFDLPQMPCHATVTRNAKQTEEVEAKWRIQKRNSEYKRLWLMFVGCNFVYKVEVNVHK